MDINLCLAAFGLNALFVNNYGAHTIDTKLK